MAGGCQTSESQPREAPQEGRQDQPQQEERQWGDGEARDWVTGFKFACCKHGFLQAWTVIERRCRHAATTQDRPANQDEEGDGQNGNSVRTTPGQGDIPQNQSQNEAWQEPTQYYEPAQPPAPGPAQGQSHHGDGDAWNNLENVDSTQWRSWQPRQRQSQSQGQQGQASSSSWQDGWNQGQNDWNQGGWQSGGERPEQSPPAGSE